MITAADLLEPIALFEGGSTLESVRGPLCQGRPVFFRFEGRWCGVTSRSVVGFPTTRRLADLPYVVVEPVAPDAPIAELARCEPALEWYVVGDGERLLGGIRVQRLADATCVEPRGAPLVSAIAAGCAHDVANALIAVQAAMLEVGGAVPGVSQERADALLRGAADAARHAAALLHRLREGPSRDPGARCDPRGVLKGLSAALVALCGPTRLRLLVDEVIAEVGMDRVDLERIVLNLVRNAVQAAGPGGTVRIALSPDEAGVRLEVSDDGPGIPDAMVDEVFRPGVTEAGGLGLGLAVVSRLARAAGGTVDVWTSPSGTRMEVRLPAA